MARGNRDSGDLTYIRSSDAPISVDPADLPHIPLNRARELQGATLATPELTTVRKKGASQPGYSVNEMIRRQGGNPNFRPPKRGGFILKSTEREIARVRKKKMTSRVS